MGVLHPEPPPGEFEWHGWHYHLERRWGAGGFGVGWEAVRGRDGGAEQRVAVKVLHPGAPESERFRDELSHLLRHPHERFVHVLDVVTVQGRPGVVMERVDGEPLTSVAGGSVGERVVAEIGARVDEVLVKAWDFQPPGSAAPLWHLHRDLKPANLMVTTSGEVRVLDLGAAWAAPEHRDAFTRRDGGHPHTPGYAAPEVARRVPSTRAEDVYGLGATLLALRTGLSFQSCHEHAPALDLVAAEPLGRVLADMLQAVPARRPPMEEVRQRLDAVARTARGPDSRAWVGAGRPTGPVAGDAPGGGTIVPSTRAVRSAPPPAPRWPGVAGLALAGGGRGGDRGGRAGRGRDRAAGVSADRGRGGAGGRPDPRAGDRGARRRAVARARAVRRSKAGPSARHAGAHSRGRPRPRDGHGSHAHLELHRPGRGRLRGHGERGGRRFGGNRARGHGHAGVRVDERRRQAEDQDGERHRGRGGAVEGGVPAGFRTVCEGGAVTRPGAPRSGRLRGAGLRRRGARAWRSVVRTWARDRRP